jgi:hypothetical protein
MALSSLQAHLCLNLCDFLPLLSEVHLLRVVFIPLVVIIGDLIGYHRREARRHASFAPLVVVFVF